MKRFSWLLFPLCLFLLIPTACTFSVSYRDGKFTCKTNTDCPEGYLCNTSNLCYRMGGKELPGCDGSSCRGEPPKEDPKTFCTKNDDCPLTETCRPNLDDTGRFCVLRCNVVTQVGCRSSEVCVASENRGYCATKRNSKREGQLCKEELDCELHLYCRPVKGYPSIRRCAKTCDLRKGCNKSGQICQKLRPENDPIGFCEPVPQVVKEGEICQADLICPSNLQCIQKRDEPFGRCLRKEPAPPPAP